MSAPAGGAATAAPLLPGSICVKLGFEQHYGECWNDSLSMFLLFADGYKEITQPLLIDTDSHPALIDAFMKKITPALPAAEDAVLRGMLEEYLQFLSYRFQYHIKHIKEVGNSVRKVNRSIRRLSLTCSLKTATGLLEILNFLKKHNRLDFLGINAMSLHIIKRMHIETGMERNWVGYDPVGTISQIKFGVLELLHRLFGISDKKRVGTVTTSGTVFVISLTLKDEDTDDEDDEDDEAHVITVFKCNDKWYLYDDNMTLLEDFTPVLTGDRDTDYAKMVEQIKQFYAERGFPVGVGSIDTLETLRPSSSSGRKRFSAYGHRRTTSRYRRRITSRNHGDRKIHKHKRTHRR